ncbi:MAG: YihY/virulence factor BrkB family protein [Bacteroidota bacterium]
MLKKIKQKLSDFLELKYIKIIVDSIQDFTSNQSMSFAAGTAFYTIFSLPAFLIIILNIGASVYEKSEIREELFTQVESVAGTEARSTLANVLENFAFESNSMISASIAILIMVFSATTVFVSLQNAINHIWHIKPKPKTGILKFLFNRLLSFSLVAAIGFILIVSLLLDALVSVAFKHFSDILEGLGVYALFVGELIISQLVLVIIFALMFKILPDAKVRWKDTWTGAIITTLLFLIGKFLIGLYMGTNDLGSTYGAAGSLVILLIWVYYSVIIFLFGAQITFYIAENIGGNIQPSSQAVKIEIKEIENTKDEQET